MRILYIIWLKFLLGLSHPDEASPVEGLYSPWYLRFFGLLFAALAGAFLSTAVSIPQIQVAVAMAVSLVASIVLRSLSFYAQANRDRLRVQLRWQYSIARDERLS